MGLIGHMGPMRDRVALACPDHFLLGQSAASYPTEAGKGKDHATARRCGLHLASTPCRAMASKGPMSVPRPPISSPAGSRDGKTRRLVTDIRWGWVALAVMAGAAAGGRGLEDGFALTVFGLFLAWLVVSWLLERGIGGRRPALLRWLALQVAAGILLAGFVAANAVALMRERAARQWHEHTADYGDAFPAIGREARVPHEGGMLAPQLDMTMKGPWTGETIRFRTNNLGFRRLEDTAVEKPAGTLRILFLGDSFVAGYRVENDAVFGAQLEEMLAARLRTGELAIDIEQIEVLNVTVDSFHQALYWLDRQAAPLDPDLVVYNTCLTNDFSQSLFGLGIPPDPPYGEWVWGENGVPEPLPAQLFDVAEQAFAEWLDRPEHVYPDGAFREARGDDYRSAARNAVERTDSFWPLGRALGDARLAYEFHRDYAGVSFAPEPGHPVFAYGDTALFLRETPRPYDVAYETAERLLAGFAEWSRAQQVPVLLVVIPARFDVVEQDRAATFDESLLRPEAFDLAKPSAFLEEQARRHGFAFFDLAPAFRVHGANAYRLFMPSGDIHWNAAGHRVAAEALLPAVAGAFERRASE